MPLRRTFPSGRNIELLRAAVSFKEATVWGVTIHRTGARAAVLRQPAALSYCLHRGEFANDPCQGPIIANAVEPGFPVPGSRAFLERAKQNVRKDRCIPCADRRAPEKTLDFQN
jgi:hypothetical protein